MKTGKRILTILLTLCVVFTMMPLAGAAGLAAYAADGKGAEGNIWTFQINLTRKLTSAK